MPPLYRFPVASRLAIAGLALALGAAGCGRGTDAPQGGGAPENGGTVVVGMRTDFGGLNPVTNTDQYTDEVIKYALYTPLVQYDSTFNVRPYLARSWELEGDSAVVFHLRSDVRWHDGQPVTAEDVKFTFDLAKDPATASLIGSAYLSEVSGAEVLDPETIRFSFARPHAQALEDFWWAPLPKHLLAGVAPAQLRTAPFNRMPVGSGPYRIVEWRANDRLVLERNDDFPAELGGPPHLDRVIFRIIPEPSTMMTELLTGGVQVDVPVIPDQAAQLKTSPGVQFHAYPSRTVYYIGWNTRRAPFNDARVRRALTLATDRQEIIDALLHGHGTLASSPIPPWSPFHPREVSPLPHDPARAASLLESAGWSDRNGDGIRENAAGQPLRFTLMTSDNPLSRAVVEVVQAQLKKVGVDARIQILEFQTMLSQHRAREFDAVFHSWVLDNFQVASAPASLFHSRWANVAGSANRSSYANARADKLIERGAAATDPAEARQVWAEFTELMNEEQPLTFMFWKDELTATQERVQGVTMDARGDLSSIARWWLPRGGR